MKYGYALLIVSAALFVAGSACAGTHGGGIKGGLLISDPAGADRATYGVESLNTVSFGAFYRYTFSGVFSAQTDFLYAHKGARGTYSLGEGKIHIWYFEIAPSLQCRILDAGGFFGSLFAGPLYDLRLQARFETDFGGVTRSYGINSGVKMNDFGFFFGAKLGLSRGSQELGVDVRYSAGFTAPNDTAMDVDLKNRTFSVMLELSFGKV
jgi:hypothetical protein